MENSEFRTFAKIGIIWLPKSRIFSEIIGSFIIAKFLKNLTKILTKIRKFLKNAMRNFSLITVLLCNFLVKNIGAKAARKMLVKLTTDVSIVTNI